MPVTTFSGALLMNSSLDSWRSEFAMSFSSCWISFTRRALSGAVSVSGSCSKRSNSGVERTAPCSFGAVSFLSSTLRLRDVRWLRARAARFRTRWVDGPDGRRKLELLVDLVIGSKGSGGGDDLLEDGHLHFSAEVGRFFVELRIMRECDRLRPLRLISGEPLPELLGEERHDGVEQAHGALEHGEDVFPVVVGGGSRAARIRVQLEFFELDVPVAELVP